MSSDSLYSIWGLHGSGPTDIWAAAAHAEVAGAVFHWDGAQWSSGLVQAQDYITSVWSNAVSDAWAVGYDCVVLHWDGASWSTVDCPSTNTDLALISVSAAGRNDVWTVGGQYAYHYDGSTWTEHHSDNGWSGQLLARSADDVWWLNDGSTRPLRHWDGSTWEENAPVPETVSEDGQWRNLWLDDDGVLWAFGFDQLFRWDGGEWTSPVSVPAELDGGQTAWGPSADEIWITDESKIYGWDGSSWRLEFQYNYGMLCFDVLWGTGAGDLWAASSHTVFHRVLSAH